MNADRTKTTALWTSVLAQPLHGRSLGLASQAAIDGGVDHLVLTFAHEAVRSQDSHGQLGFAPGGNHGDGGTLVEAVSVSAATGSAAAVEACERQRWWLLRHSPRAFSGVVHLRRGADQVGVESVYSVVPALAATGDFAPADMQYRMHRDLLHDPGTGLWRTLRDAETGEWMDEEPRALGQGWVAAGLARALSIGGPRVPAEMRGRWQRELRELLDACATHVRSDGQFPRLLSGSAGEVDGTAGLLLSYAAWTGVAAGYLDARHSDDAAAYLTGWLQHADRPAAPAEEQAAALLALYAHAKTL